MMYLRIGYEHGILLMQEHQRMWWNETKPHRARKCMPRHIKLIVVGCRIIIFNCWLTCVFHEAMSIYATEHAYMISNKPLYDMANSKHGIPIDNTIPILAWALFLCLSVMVTYKFRVRSHRLIWMKRRTKMELRLIVHINPFPVLRDRVKINSIVKISCSECN